MDDPSGPSSLKNGILSNLSLFIVKGSVALSCGSATMYAATLYSLSNTVNSFFSLLGLKKASRPADSEHPFGHGKEIFIWSFIATVFMLGVAGMGAIGRGLEQIREPYAVTLDTLPLLALTTAFLYECYLLKTVLTGRARKKANDGENVLSNYFCLFNGNKNPLHKTMVLQSYVAVIGTGVSLGTMLIARWTGNYLIDGLASICVGLLFGSMGFFLAFQLKELIIGCSAAPDTVRFIDRLVMNVPGVTDILKIKTMFIGPQSLLINMEIKVKNDLDVASIEDVTGEIEKIIKANISMAKHINIETFADDIFRNWEKTDFDIIPKAAVSKVM